MATARFVRMIEGWQGNAQLFELSEPLDGGDRNKFNHVIVSAAVVPYSGAETYIFGADADGNVISWNELEGSYRGGLEHSEALAGAGYDTIT